MKLKHKLLIGYGVSFFILGWVVVWAVINMIQLGRAAQAILSENYRSIIAAENMIDALERQDSAVLLMMLGDKQRGVKLFQENQINFLKWSARANDNITIPGEHDLLVEITDVYQQFCQSTIDLLQ